MTAQSVDSGRRTSRRAASTVATLLLLAVTAIAAVVAYGTLTNNRWYRVVAIEGASMSPALEQGDAVVITRPPAHLHPGMVVVLQVNDRLVTHRIVSVARDGTFVTKGDANDYPDDWANAKVRVAGVVRLDVPFLGRILRNLGSAAWLNDRSEVPVDGTSG